jgi:hypothetical protein
MHAIIAATLLSVSPSPHDIIVAHADLTLPPAAAIQAVRTPRSRLAAILALRHLGGLDEDAGDYAWFSPGLSWESECDLARRIVAKARDCPTESDGAWVPPKAWFAARSAWHYAVAAHCHQQAEDHRGRVEWEIDRSEALHAKAREFDAVAQAHSDEACRFSGWSGTSWTRPRRVVLREVREWLGEAAWEARAWPE